MQAQFPFGKNIIELFHNAHILFNDFTVVRNHYRQLIQDPAFFIFLIDHKRLQLLMILRDGRRLHKQRIACRRFIDHRTAYFKLILFFHRDAEVSVTYGAEAVRHTFLIRPHDRFRLLFHPFLRSFHISSKRLQQLRRHIVHSAVSNLHLDDIFYLFEIIQILFVIGKRNIVLFPSAQIIFQPHHGNKRLPCFFKLRTA